MEIGFDAELGAQAGVAAALARFVIFPIVTYRLRGATDGDEHSGRYLVPKSLQKAVAFSVLSLGSAAVGVAQGKPLFAAASAGAVGAVAAMALFDLQHKRVE